MVGIDENAAIGTAALRATIVNVVVEIALMFGVAKLLWHSGVGSIFDRGGEDLA